MIRPATLAFETTLRIRDTCFCLHVQRAARALARRYDEALRPLGLTSGQFSLLMSLNRAVPVWQRTHDAIEGQLAAARPDQLRADLRALS